MSNKSYAGGPTGMPHARTRRGISSSLALASTLLVPLANGCFLEWPAYNAPDASETGAFATAEPAATLEPSSAEFAPPDPACAANQCPPQAALDACAIDNGGCGARLCTSTAMGATCARCPMGYSDLGEACGPALIDLQISTGSVAREMSMTGNTYSVAVPISVPSIALAPLAPAGAVIAIDGQPLLTGAIWNSPPLALGDTTIAISVSQPEYAASHYALTVRRSNGRAHQANPSEVAADDRFGDRIAIDRQTLLVAAPGDDGPGDAAPDSGTVYVFERAPLDYTPQAELRAPSGHAGDRFGFAIAVDGDTIAVSATGDDSGATGIDGDPDDDTAPDSGAVWIFARLGQTWTLQAYLKPARIAPGATFGSSLALSGDTLVVGAPLEDRAVVAAVLADSPSLRGAPVESSGAAYVFVRKAGLWSQQAQLSATDAPANALFGGSVAISDDTIAVGAEGHAGDDGTQIATGATYLFVRTDGAWSQQQRLTASNASSWDAFGASVALFADTLVVGAYGEASLATGIGAAAIDESAYAAGAAYVFERAEGLWSQTAYLKASNSAAQDWFGSSVKIAQDAIVVGAYGEDSSARGIDGDQSNDAAIDSGAAYLFGRVGGAWSQQGYFKAANAGAGAGHHFGARIAMSADTIAIGAPLEASEPTTALEAQPQAVTPALATGAVYLFE
jgi:hypothetical protein